MSTATVEVEWMDGRTETYECLQAGEVGTMLLHITQDGDSHVYLPYDHIRSFRVRIHCAACGGTKEVVRGGYKFPCTDCAVEAK